MDLGVFLQILDGLSSADNQIILQCSEAISKMQAENPQIFLALSIEVFQDATSNLNRIINCLSGILKLINPNNENPISKICEFWNDPSISELTSKIKFYLLNCLPNENLPIQNLSAFAFALIFVIESKDRFDVYWSNILEQLSKCIVDASTSEPSKHGCLTFFTEIMHTPIFQKKSEFQNFLMSYLHDILGSLIGNLSFPEKNSEDLFKHSVQFVYELITAAPRIILNEEEASILLNSYNSALPKCFNPEDYQHLFVAMLELFKYNYQRIDSLMCQIYDLVDKGIHCPNKSLVIISIEFWEQICLYEQSLPKKSIQFYSKKVMELLFNDFITIISQMDNEISNASVSLLRNFTKLFPHEMMELSHPIFEKTLSNPDQLENPEKEFYVFFQLINALCVKNFFDAKNESGIDSELYHYFFVIIDIITKTDSPVLIHSGLVACNSLIHCSTRISNDEKTFEFVIAAIKNTQLMLNFKIIVFQICQSLFKNCENSFALAKHFDDFFNVLFELAFDANITDTEESIYNVFSSLRDLIGMVKNELCLSNSYPVFFQLLQKYNEIINVTDNFPQIRLKWILDIIGKYIYCLDNAFSPFAPNLISEMIKTSSVHRDLAYEDVLMNFGHLCTSLRKEFANSQNVIELVEYGLISQSPSIIKTSFELYSDLFIYVGTDNLNPIVTMFQIRENFPFIFDMVKFCFIDRFALMLLGPETDNAVVKTEFPQEYLDEYKAIIDSEIERNMFDPQSLDFDLQYATEFYKSVFNFYAAFFERTEQDQKAAENFILIQVRQCYKSGAYTNIDTLYALYRLLNVFYRKFKTKLIVLNDRFLKSMLLDKQILSNEDKKYQKKFQAFFEMIRTGK